MIAPGYKDVRRYWLGSDDARGILATCSGSPGRNYRMTVGLTPTCRSTLSRIFADETFA